LFARISEGIGDAGHAGDLCLDEGMGVTPPAISLHEVPRLTKDPGADGRADKMVRVRGEALVILPISIIFGMIELKRG
jgi:hypothetical protein